MQRTINTQQSGHPVYVIWKGRGLWAEETVLQSRAGRKWKAKIWINIRNAPSDVCLISAVATVEFSFTRAASANSAASCTYQATRIAIFQQMQRDKVERRADLGCTSAHHADELPNDPAPTGRRGLGILPSTMCAHFSMTLCGGKPFRNGTTVRGTAGSRGEEVCDGGGGGYLGGGKEGEVDV